MRRDGTYRRNVLVIGAGEAGNQLIKEINNSRYVKKKVVGRAWNRKDDHD